MLKSFVIFIAQFTFFIAFGYMLVAIFHAEFEQF